MSFNILIKSIIDKNSPIIVGLDPILDLIPNHIKDSSYKLYGHTLEAAANAILKFNISIIDTIHDLVPAIKPQLAYYEMYGYHGIKALQQTVQYAKQKQMYVIMDGKRNDIGTTMSAYSSAYLGKVNINGTELSSFDADSLTVNPYLGEDSITPLVLTCKKYNKSFFVLVKTSNKSSGEVQDQLSESTPIYEIIGKLCEKWGKDLQTKYGYSNVGAVIGATYPDQLKTLRALLPNTLFLIPGYGAQGGTTEDIIPAFDKNGLGAIINSSRAIIYAYKEISYSEKDYLKATKQQLVQMKTNIIKAIPPIRLP